jgi:hypothetical protein
MLSWRLNALLSNSNNNKAVMVVPLQLVDMVVPLLPRSFPHRGNSS